MSGIRRPADFGAAYAEAFSSGDIKRVLPLYEPTAVLQLRDGKRHDGIDDIAAAFQPILAKGLRMETSARFLVEHRDLTLIRYDYSLFETSGTKVYSASSCELLRRSADGCWRLAIDLPSGSSDV